ncbi:MAG: hypothetical protein GKR88_02820 [Flavobacteriaceae bacterium]|nr:MAG: hypothetical protein GKR88_02820 [Flavobacteriaceae bacterium]
MKTKLLFILGFIISYHVSAQQKEDLIKSSGDIITASNIVKGNRDLTQQINPKTIDSNPAESSRSTSSSEAGSTEGQFSVSLTGAATYQVPFVLPLGIKDVRPSVGLSFSSQAGSGIAGWGWSISGLSSITRIPSTKYHDGTNDGVDFDGNDRFALDGQRLILKSGTYGAAGSIYQTENYSNIKVIAYGTSPYGAAYGPSYFIVFYPNGARAWYGNGGNSRNRLEWALYDWRDPQGNVVIYNYTQLNGLSRINNIQYGGRAGYTSRPNIIQFYYRNPDREDVIYVNNQTFTSTSLLTRVEVRASGSLFRKYELTHDQTSLGYNRLIEIKESNGQGKSFSPITFNYSNTSSNLYKQSPATIYPGFDITGTRLVSGEFNGDGYLDFITYNKNQRNKINIFEGFMGSSSNISKTYTTSSFDDIIANNMINHQGKVLSQQGITLITENNGNVKFKSYYSGAAGLYYQYTKDWNAPTYIYENYCEDDINISTTINSGHNFSDYGRTVTASNVIRSGANATYEAERSIILKPGFHAQSGSNFSAKIAPRNIRKIPKEYISGDFNGDGLTDIIAITKPHTIRTCRKVPCDDDDFYRNADKNSNESKVDKTKVSEILRPIEEDCCECSSYTVNTASATFIDLNRNKTSDYIKFLGGLQSNLSGDYRIETADFNGDGRTDLYIFKEGHLYVYSLNNSNQLTILYSTTDSLIKMDRPIVMGDYNGDGKADFMLPTAVNNDYWRFYISKGSTVLRYNKKMPLQYVENRAGGQMIIGGYYFNSVFTENHYLAQDVNGDGKTDFIKHFVATEVTTNSKSVETVSIYENMLDSSDSRPTFIASSSISERDNGITKYGTPIQIQTATDNNFFEYAYVDDGKVHVYEFTKNHQEDIKLLSVDNNGIFTQIEYEKLGYDDNHPYNVPSYTADYNELYPYININFASSLPLVKKITQTGGGISRHKLFKYEGAVSHIGLGFIGFKTTKRTNWDGNGVSTIWNISKYNPQLKGAVTQQWTSMSDYSGNTSSHISKVDYTYDTHLASNKVFKNLPILITSQDALQGISTSENYTYGDYALVTRKTTNFQGGSSQIDYEYSSSPSSTSQYYHVGRITREIETNTLGGNSFTSEKQYSYNNNLLSQLKVKGSGTPWNTETYSYDGFGNVTQKILSSSGLSSRTETFKYDTSGRFMIESKDIEGLKTIFTYDSFGNTKTLKNPFNLLTTYEYGGWNRITKETDYIGKITTTSYIAINGGGMEVKTDYTQGQDEIIRFNTFGWEIENRALSLNNKWIKVFSEYDIIGRKVRVSEPTVSSASQWSTVTYDAYGRVVSQVSATGRVITTSYNGLSTTVDDGVKTKTSTIDGAGNIVSMQDDGGTINYTYHGNGLMKSANYGGHLISTQIDGWGRKVSLTDPSSGTYNYTLNNLGELLQETTPKGSTIYTYDSFGKLTRKELTGNFGNTGMVIDYTYNGTSKLLSSIQASNSISGDSYTYTYSYDSYKRLYKTQEVNSKASFEHTVTRDSYGRVNSETYNSTNLSNGFNSTVSVNNVYDYYSGILKRIVNGSNLQTLWSLNSLDHRGNPTSVGLGNGITKKRTYDQFGYLTSILDEKRKKSDIINLLDPPEPIIALKANYNFNAERGNLMSRENVGLDWSESFTYDHLDRLTQISGSVSNSKSYDSRGRITNNSDIGQFSYTSGSIYRINEATLNSSGDNYYTSHALQQVKFNAFKKPIEIEEEGHGIVNFQYNPMLMRSHAYYGNNEENINNRRYYKHYSGISAIEITEDTQSNTTKIVTYIGGDAYTAPVAHIKTNGSNAIDDYHYLHRDYLGSILAISNADAEILEQRQFGAWGKTDKFLEGENQSTFGYESLISRGYSGHEHFFDVSLIHMNGRMYDPNLGRFLSPDNYIQEPFDTQNFNRYGYVLNNPLKYTDPSGEVIWGAVLIGAIIGGTVGAITYLIRADMTGNWSWGGFASAIFGGALSGAIAGVVAPQTVIGSFLSNGYGGSVVLGLASAFLPSKEISIGKNLSFNLSLALAAGNASGFGINAGFEFSNGNFSISAGVGFTYFGSAHGTGHSGWEYRKSWGINWDDGHQGVGVYSTTFSGMKPQKVGGFSFNKGDFNFRYENDDSNVLAKYTAFRLANRNNYLK